MVKKMMKGAMLLVALMFMQVQNLAAQTLSGEAFLKSLKGTYVELFRAVRLKAVA